MDSVQGLLATAVEDMIVTTQLLLVEPDEELLVSYRRYLERRGYDVASVGSGPECLEQMRSNPPDVLILEPQLPGDWGRKILELCRTGTGRPHPPVIALSKRGPAFISSPIQAYHVKPISMSALVDSIEHVLDQIRTHR